MRFVTIKSLKNKITKLTQSSIISFSKRALITIIFMALWNEAFAEGDPLNGMLGGLTATMSSGGAGRAAAFIIEGIVGTATFIKTKNLLMMFGAPLAIELFLQLVLKLAVA